MSERARLRMTREECQALLERGRKVFVSTNNPEGWPHLVPMSYVLSGEDVTLWTDPASRKIRNLRDDNRITCLVEEGASLPEFRAVQIIGRGEIDDDPEQSERIGIAMLTRYSPAPLPAEAVSYAKTLAAQRTVVRVRAERIVSWDHRKMGVDLGEIGS